MNSANTIHMSQAKANVEFSDNDASTLKVAKESTFVRKLGDIADWFMRLRVSEATHDILT